jgi:tripartite-type tricarboxylate transporter receptor subunit TctC
MTLLNDLNHRFLHLIVGAATLLGISLFFLAFAGSDAQSQTARTIKIVAPFPPGGSVDILSRLLGEQISKVHGITVIVENRPGAGASIAYEAVARAAPDGNTLVINANSMVIVPHMRKVNFDPLTSYEPICYLLKSPQVIVVHSASPYRTLSDLVDAAHAKPGELSFATVGPATTQHIGFEQFRRLANINMIYVPYAGGVPALNALLGGHITAVLANYSEVVEQLKAGTLRALATTSLKRIEPLPDVPTVAELGYKDYQAEVWFGVVAPAKTPKETITELANWFTAAMQAPEVKPKLINLGLYPVGICGAEFAAHIRKQSNEYGRIIRDANIKAE